MNDPEKAIAVLAINLIADRRKRPRSMKERLEIWPSRARVEELASIVLDNDNLPIEPYVAHVVTAIVKRFDNLSSNSALPTEKQILDLITASGGIAQILLRMI
jgi:hypothetical protein